MELRRDFPAECGVPACHRSFNTERGAAQHRRTCWHSPDAPCYVSGAYDPILNGKGWIVGYIWNGRSEQERRRIRDEMDQIRGVIGIPPAVFGESKREVVLGPDVTEPCALCPDSRGRHVDNVGACQGIGCRCSAFVGAMA